MKRLATLLVLSVPSIALAHPGHDHAGIAESHHLSGVGMFIASVLAAGAGVALYRYLRNKSN